MKENTIQQHTIFMILKFAAANCIETINRNLTDKDCHCLKHQFAAHLDLKAGKINHGQYETELTKFKLSET